ncbi:MAG: CPBP family intramembrane glutamic endopeptidase [Acidobacteriaceae bacterium]
MPANPKKSWNPFVGPGRKRSLMRFVLAAAWFVVADSLAATAAHGLAHGDFYELLHRTFLVFLLLVGFGYMGFAFDQQPSPLKAMGLERRAGWVREWGIGAAFGWAVVVACVLPIALAGDLHVSFWTEPRAFWLFSINLVMLAVAALVEEVGFRGYPFQRLIETFGPTTATLLMSCMFGLIHLTNPAASMESALVTMLAGVLLSLAYLRTKALWLPWGLHFAWNVSMGVFFGLPVSGLLGFSTVIQSRALGPHWLTGGSYGPEASDVTAIVLIVAIFVLLRVTREYAWKYNQPVIVAGGIPVDIPAPAAHAVLHPEEARTPAPPALIQIQPIPSVPLTAPQTESISPSNAVPSVTPDTSSTQ